MYNGCFNVSVQSHQLNEKKQEKKRLMYYLHVFCLFVFSYEDYTSKRVDHLYRRRERTFRSPKLLSVRTLARLLESGFFMSLGSCPFLLRTCPKYNFEKKMEEGRKKEKKVRSSFQEKKGTTKMRKIKRMKMEKVK